MLLIIIIIIKFIILHNIVATGGVKVRVSDSRSRGRSFDSLQVVHTHVHMSPSSTYILSKGGDAQRD